MRYKKPPKFKRIIEKEKVAKIIEKIKLSNISIRLPVKCNLNCEYCYGTNVDYEKEQKTLLSYSELIDLLGQAFDLGITNVSFVGDGEPMLYKDEEKDIFSLIDYINSKDIDVTIFTNATTINKKIARKLYKRRVFVITKQNSLNPNIQNKICRKSFAYEKIKRGLNSLKKVGFNKKPSRLAIHTVICKKNYNEIPRLWRRWRSENIIPYVQVGVPPFDKEKQRHFCDKVYVEPEKVKKLFRKLLEIDEKEFGYIWDPDETYPAAAFGCNTLRTSIGITPRGDIQFCSYLEESLGNIRESTLEEVLNSKKVKKIRTFCYYENTKNPLFYGCRALTYNLTGDRFAKDPFYWK